MRPALLAAVTLACLARSVAAQDTLKIELGVDAAITYKMGTPGITNLSIPLSRIRIGWPISSRISLEPMFSATAFNGNGFNSRSYTLGLGVPISLRTDPHSWQPFMRPYLSLVNTLSRQSSGKETSNGTMLVGAGVGLRIPFRSHIFWRFEGSYENQIGESHLLALAGLSIFSW